MGRLDGKVCFVTGAGSGIGAKTAELFAHEGASVIMADMHEENLSKVAADIQAAGLISDSIAAWEASSPPTPPAAWKVSSSCWV